MRQGLWKRSQYMGVEVATKPSAQSASRAAQEVALLQGLGMSVIAHDPMSARTMQPSAGRVGRLDVA